MLPADRPFTTGGGLMMASVAATADGPIAAARPRRAGSWPARALCPLLLFLPPSLILFTVFVVLPMVDATTFSFFDWTGYGPITDFVGFKNYDDVLTHRNWGTAVRNSLLVVAVSLTIQLPLAMWCAIALSERGTASTSCAPSSSCPSCWPKSPPA